MKLRKKEPEPDNKPENFTMFTSEELPTTGAHTTKDVTITRLGFARSNKGKWCCVATFTKTHSANGTAAHYRKKYTALGYEFASRVDSAKKTSSLWVLYKGKPETTLPKKEFTKRRKVRED